MNRVTDALSEHTTLLATMQTEVPSFESIKELLHTDPCFCSIIEHLQVGESKDFILQDGFLFKGNKLCIPDCNLRLKIIKELHEEGHVGWDTTLQLVYASYFWPTMRKEVGRFVERCRIY